MNHGIPAQMKALAVMPIKKNSLRNPDYRSLEELENNVWPDIDFPTPLVERCYKFRKIPVKDLTVSQLGTLIRQNFGIEFLLFKAIHILELDILAEGDFYPGELLVAVMSISDWPNEELKQSTKLFVGQRIEYIQGINEANEHRQILNAIEKFLKF